MTIRKRNRGYLWAVIIAVMLVILAGCSAEPAQSAYDTAVQNGFTGTKSEWVVSLAGDDSHTAYDAARDLGYKGTAAEWLASLIGEAADLDKKGTNGVSAYTLAVANGFSGSETDWLKTLIGEPGLLEKTDGSAYDLACRLGYEGTLAQWLDALLDGQKISGVPAYEAAVKDGCKDGFVQWLASMAESDGKASYKKFVDQGFEGSLQEWLLELIGSDATVPEQESTTVPDEKEDATVSAETDAATAPEDDTEATVPEKTEELTVVGAYINNQMHLIHIMSDGSEVDMGSVESEETYTVIFQNRDGLVIKTENVPKGGNATPPEVPAVKGYVFAGWDGSYKNVTEDRMLQATYIPESTDPVEYQVIFADHDGTVLSEQRVQKGAAAVEPAAPVRDGYQFTGWDKDFTNIKSDLTVTAQYQELPKALQFTADNVQAKAGDTVKIAVSVQNNPGVVGMCMHIDYDESVLSLVSCENSAAFEELSMTPPRDKRSGCVCVWYGADVSEILDGEMLIITFEVKTDAPSGDADITLSPVDIYDRNLEEHTAPEAHCQITVNG